MRHGLFGATALSLSLISCGGGSSPTAPSGSTTPTPTTTTPTTPTAPVSTACRTGIATYRIVTTAPTFTSTVNGTCTMNAAQTEGTCTNVYTDTIGGSFTSVSVTRHATKADIVDEVSVIPPRVLSLGTTSTVNPGGTVPASVNTGTISYDSQRRQVLQSNISSPSGQTSVTTYTAWDSGGRPTAGTTVTAGGSTPVNYAYNDATRTQSTTNSGITCTQTFDANGNPLVGTCAGAVATFTTITTQQVCK